MEKDEDTKIYDRFVEILQEFSATPRVQIENLQGTAGADELATDFSEIALAYAKSLLSLQLISNDQYLVVEAIDKKLDEMSNKPELWSEEALYKSNEWNECRETVRTLLNSLCDI